MVKKGTHSKIYSVIGLGFGDEGKGIVTDFIASKSPKDSLVIRYCSGQQAKHTVVYNGIRFVFSSFGSGTLRGVPTYLSQFCTVSVEMMLDELYELNKIKYNPILYVNNNCPLTTHYELYYNRSTESKNKHGSCGFGVGATFRREEKFYHLNFGDIYYPKILKEKLKNVKEFYSYSVDFSWDDEVLLEQCEEIRKSDNIFGVWELPKARHYIFEGAQGLLLDQHIGFFPNVTRSNTGTKNILEIINGEIELFLVIRPYFTRRHKGYMGFDDIPIRIKENKYDTRKPNFEGLFRKGILDVPLLQYAIEKDDYIRRSKNKNLVITYLDYLEEYKLFHNEEIIDCKNKKGFANMLSKLLDIKNVYTVGNDESSLIKKVL